MASHAAAADDEPVGGEADAGLGAPAPPGEVGFGPLSAVPPPAEDSEAQPSVGLPFGLLAEHARGSGGHAVSAESPMVRPVRPPVGPPDDLGDEAAMVRPYAWTGGRTKANYDLKLETLISTTDLGQDEARLPQLEHRAVSSLCRYPLSVAEVAAKLSIPLGVARVILSDMAELGLISIHRTFADDDIAAHLVLMERVLSGLRRL
jgi:hypothetical protein